MVVQHFKRQTVKNPQSKDYLYIILAFATHTETGETFAIYQALYGDRKVCARPYDMFISKVDKQKYPYIKQEYRFEEYHEEKRCPSYTGVACVDGSCPIANREEYIEYGVPVINSCDECSSYKGCEDCAWCGENDECTVVEE